MNKDRLYNQTCAKVTFCFGQYGFSETMNMIAEAIDDHIAENLRRGTDEVAKQFLTDKKRKLMGLI